MPWRRTLADLIETGSFRTQRELVRALEARTGRQLNQATVSRELRHLGARKVDGVYALGAAELELASHVHDMQHTAGGCMVVLHTDLAFASVVAQTLDEARLPGVLGTIAGDDTVFVAVSGPSTHAGIALVLGLEPRRS